MKNKCLTGFAHSGKDTLGDRLAEILGMDTYALAQPIKDIMCALFGWGEDQRNGAYKEITLLYSISPENLDQAGILYAEYGLDEYEAFHDCWEKLVDLFEIRIEENDLGYCYISPRKSFQTFGTDWGRAIDDNIWLDIAPKDNTIITDVRFNNEAQHFIYLGAKVIEIVRPGFKPVNNGHVSEDGVSKNLIDYQYVNKYGLEEIYEYAEELARYLRHDEKYI